MCFEIREKSDDRVQLKLHQEYRRNFNSLSLKFIQRERRKNEREESGSIREVSIKRVRTCNRIEKARENRLREINRESTDFTG